MVQGDRTLRRCPVSTTLPLLTLNTWCGRKSTPNSNILERRKKTSQLIGNFRRNAGSWSPECHPQPPFLSARSLAWLTARRADTRLIKWATGHQALSTEVGAETPKTKEDRLPDLLEHPEDVTGTDCITSSTARMPALQSAVLGTEGCPRSGLCTSQLALGGPTQITLKRHDKCRWNLRKPFWKFKRMRD